MEFKIKKGDFLFIAILILIILLTAIPIFSVETSENVFMVCIEIDGEEHSRIPIDMNTQIDIDGVGTVVINDSEVYIEKSSCKDKICERMGKISKSYQTIICLPNKMIIKIISDTEDFDGIAG